MSSSCEARAKSRIYGFRSEILRSYKQQVTRDSESMWSVRLYRSNFMDVLVSALDGRLAKRYVGSNPAPAAKIIIGGETPESEMILGPDGRLERHLLR